MENKVLNAGLWLKDNAFRLIVLFATSAMFIFAVFHLANNANHLKFNIESIIGLTVLGLICLFPIAITLCKIIASKNNAYIPYTLSEILLKAITTVAVVFAYYIFIALFIILPATL